MEHSMKKTLKDLVSPRQIIVASDLTDLETLLPHAVAQAHACRAQVSLVHAVAVPDAVLLGEISEDVIGAIERHAQQVLSNAARRLEHEGIVCSVTARRGAAVVVVRAEIEKTGATRLIIGTHSHGHTGQTMIGSVANALLLTAAIPVFVIGPRAPLAAAHAVPERILHPVSFAGQYRESAAFALELAELYKADLTLAHILDSDVMNGSYVKQIFAKANRQLSEAIPARYSKSRVHTVVEPGSLMVELLRLCSTTAIDWIVIGIERDFPWWSMSNNAAYQVIAESSCPVLVVRNRLLPPVPAETSDAAATDLARKSPVGVSF